MGWPDSFLPDALRKDAGFPKEMSAYETGRISTEDFIEYTRSLLAKTFNYGGSYEDTLEAHRLIIGDAISSSVEVFLRLQESGRYKMALVSDNNPIHAEELYNKIPLVMRALPSKYVILSHEVGFDKSSPDIFRITLERLGCKPGCTLMIDDSQYKLDVCQKLGIQTHLYSKGMNLSMILNELGVIGLF